MYPRQLLSKQVHRLESAVPKVRLTMQAIIMTYNTMTCVKNTTSFSGSFLPKTDQMCDRELS